MDMERSKFNMEKVIPFLMFQDGQAEEAMNFYTSLIEDSEITTIVGTVLMKVDNHLCL